MLSVNLIPMRRRQQRLLRARKKGWIVAATAYATLLVVGYGAWRMVWGGDPRDQAQQLVMVKADIDEINQSITRVRATLQEVSTALHANQMVIGQPDWSLLLALVAKLRGDEVVLDRCGLDVSAKGPVATGLLAVASKEAFGPILFHLQGHARTQAAVSQFSLRLERTGLFETVTLLKTNREPFKGGEAMAFNLECQVKTALADPPGKAKPMAPMKNSSGAGMADVSDAGGNTP